MRRRWEGPARVIWQIAKTCTLLERAPAVLAHEHGRGQGANIQLIGTCRMDCHRPVLAIRESASWQPLPRQSTILAAVHLSCAARVHAPRLEWIWTDGPNVFTREAAGECLRFGSRE